MDAVSYEYNWTWHGYNPVSSGIHYCPPDMQFGPGVMQTHTIHFVLSGKGVFCTKGKQYSIGAGQLFSFAPFETVWYRADSEDPWCYVWINFAITGDMPFRFEQPVMDAPFLKPIFESIRDYPDHAATGRDFVANCLQQIISALSDSPLHNGYLVEKAVQYVQSHYDNENLSVSELASKLGVSRYTLSDAFRKTKHLSPSEFLVRFRLERACAFMTQQKLSPTVAAYSVGYKNYDQFGKIFKKYYGMSPRAYRQRYAASHTCE